MIQTMHALKSRQSLYYVINLQEVEEGLCEPDGVGGDRDGVGEEEHEADGAAERRAQRARDHVVDAARGDLISGRVQIQWKMSKLNFGFL